LYPIDLMSLLFDSLTIRGITFRNRIAVSPMCEYSAVNGLPNDWHLVHLGSRAVGGAALVVTEATAVAPEGRITPLDTGIYNHETQAAWEPIARFIKEQGAVAGIQLAHAGRKASTAAPWDGGKLLTEEQGGWSPVSASAERFTEGYGMPVALDLGGIAHIVASFKAAATRALEAGFEVIELHAAHGYLIHQFLSPLSNKRTDEYGGSFENRTRLAREITSAVREVWPDSHPLFIRVSATDWVEGGWTPEDTVELAKALKPLGVDLVDCSSGGNVATASIPVKPGYQVPFAHKVKSEADILTGAVGMITEPAQANQIIEQGEADIVLLARELLRDPYWPRRAAAALGDTLTAPKQYGRAW
jgi:2,4-dienoyl-CoA reductase-like NADH-dependent reductase (Old Yellow Enzyme family)